MTKIKNKEPRIMWYDLETSPLKAWIWSLGKQVVRHDQLDSKHNNFDVICVTYCFNDGKPAKVLGWGYEQQNSKKMIKEFIKIAKTADIIIGKNNVRFDDRRVNTLAFIHGLEGISEIIGKTDDLEKQMRKFFTFPTTRLDYISDILGLGGKIKMKFDDWINIVEKDKKNGLKAYNKMLKYGLKDVEDTRAIWNKMSKYFKPKINMSVFNSDHVCTNCGSKNIKANGTRIQGRTVYQQFFCNDHGGYAGRKTLGSNKIILGN